MFSYKYILPIYLTLTIIEQLIGIWLLLFLLQYLTTLLVPTEPNPSQNNNDVMESNTRQETHKYISQENGTFEILLDHEESTEYIPGENFTTETMDDDGEYKISIKYIKIGIQTNQYQQCVKIGTQTDNGNVCEIGMHTSNQANSKDFGIFLGTLVDFDTTDYEIKRTPIISSITKDHGYAGYPKTSTSL